MPFDLSLAGVYWRIHSLIHSFIHRVSIDRRRHENVSYADVTKPYGEKDSDGLWNIPAADRNKEPILAVLQNALPTRGLVVEVASGTGQHVIHFAQNLGELIWLPSDPDVAFRKSIENRIRDSGLENVRTPLNLDVLDNPWPVSEANAVICINMIHVAPWEATRALIHGVEQILSEEGVLFMYGPYRRSGTHTVPSNEAFDVRLREQNPDWGIRDLEDVEKLGERAGLFLDAVVEMPANNLSLVFRLQR